MKYDLEIRVPDREPVIPMNFDIPERTAREFKFITKQVLGIAMSKVMTEMMNEFIKEHRNLGKIKQTSFL